MSPGDGVGRHDSPKPTHPSDMCVALAALEAKVHVAGPRGDREIAFSDVHRLPGDMPQRDTNLQHDELITAIELPPRGFATNYTYLKIRDRLSCAFALVSVAAAMELDGNAIKEALLALGGVAHKPWRDPATEAKLRGHSADPSVFVRAADLLLRDARGFAHNAFKIDLARRTIVRALHRRRKARRNRNPEKKSGRKP
jgi:xanthine dehydrogenase YagS FAD-binding subunit